MKLKLVLLGAATLGGLGLQLNAASDPVSEGSRKMYASVKSNVLKSAEEMPESDFGFKPVETVRTFGQVVAHIADGQYEFCSALTPTKEKMPDVEKTKTTKAEIVEALKTSFSYCDKAYDSMTDAQAMQTVSFFGKTFAKISVLDYNIAHTDEHYGNLVTYLRMKGLVPPSSKQ